MNINFVKDIFRNEDLNPDLYKELLTKQLILRDYLAIERTILTNEATYLAYIRTSLTIIVIGVTLFKIFTDNVLLQYLGIILAISGLLVLIIGSLKTIEMRKKINKFLQNNEHLSKEVEALN